VGSLAEPLRELPGHSADFVDSGSAVSPYPLTQNPLVNSGNLSRPCLASKSSLFLKSNIGPNRALNSNNNPFSKSLTNFQNQSFSLSGQKPGAEWLRFGIAQVYFPIPKPPDFCEHKVVGG